MSFTDVQGGALATICSVFSPQDGHHLRYREVTEEDIILAKKFSTHHQLTAMVAFRNGAYEKALAFDQAIHANALLSISNRMTPTNEMIACAKKIINPTHAFFIRDWGMQYSEEILSLGTIQTLAIAGFSGIDVVGDGVTYPKPTDEELSILKQIINSGQIEAMKVLGKNGLRKVFEFNDIQGSALGIICSIAPKNLYGNRSFREVTEGDIALAKRFTKYTQLRALLVLGKSQLEKALVFDTYSQAKALELLGAERADLALNFNNAQANALYFICRHSDYFVRLSSGDDILRAKKFNVASQVNALAKGVSEYIALLFITTEQVKQLEEYGVEQYEKALLEGEQEALLLDQQELLYSLAEITNADNTKPIRLLCSRSEFFQIDSCQKNYSSLSQYLDPMPDHQGYYDRNTQQKDLYDKVIDSFNIRHKETITSDAYEESLAVCNLLAEFLPLCCHAGDL